MQTTICPSCSFSLNTKPQWIGKLVRCPQCRSTFRVEEPQDSIPEPICQLPTKGTSTSRRVISIATILISLAAGAAGGFVIGHRLEKQEQAKELADANNNAETALQNTKASKAKLVESEAMRDKEQILQLLIERDKLNEQMKFLTKTLDDLLALKKMMRGEQAKPDGGEMQPATPLTKLDESKRGKTIDFAGENFLKQAKQLSGDEVRELKSLCKAIEEGAKKYPYWVTTTNAPIDLGPLIADNADLFLDKKMLMNWLSTVSVSKELDEMRESFIRSVKIKPEKIPFVRANFMLLRQENKLNAVKAATILSRYRRVENVPQDTIECLSAKIFILSYKQLFGLDD